MKRYVYPLFFILNCMWASILSEVSGPLEFTDFPLKKVDYMYREQGGPVARLVFELWSCTTDFLQERNAALLADVELSVLKKEYHDRAVSIFKKLNTFKRFIDELAFEWDKKREKGGMREFFRKMFSRTQSKNSIEKLSAVQFYELLKKLRLFLWDVACNAPCAQKKCLDSLALAERQSFKQFVGALYEELL